jgi:hypothetical protein
MNFRWNSDLNPILAALLVLAVSVWIVIVWRRLAARFPFRTALLLVLPKALVALLVIAAVFDPAWTSLRRPDKKPRLIVMVDDSSSMDVRDRDGKSRLVRATGIADEMSRKLGDDYDVERQVFDESVRPSGPKPAGATRGTDLGGCLVTLSQRSDAKGAIGVVLLTDGGDETLVNPRLPQSPVFVVGMGGDPSGWDDISIADVDWPASVECGSDYQVTVDAQARCASDVFKQSVRSLAVELQEKQGDGWKTVSRQQVDLSGDRARVRFTVKGDEKPGVQHMRVLASQVEGELSYLNNQREFAIESRNRELGVLFFAQELGWDFAMIKRELARDPSVALTALYRVDGSRFVMQGEGQSGQEKVIAGFPTDTASLQKYKVVIIGSFAADQWRKDQMAALVEYVRGGGAVVFLGGEYSFGRGGYAGTPLDVLFPWQVGGGDGFAAGRFSVSVPAGARDQAIMSQAADELGKSGGAALESANICGSLKAGAVSLLDAAAGPKTISAVAWQRYGQGQVMGVATNTLWKWARESDQMRRVYGVFWRQAVRYLADWQEGGRFVDVRWDQEQYRSGETAAAAVKVNGSYAAGQLRVNAEVRAAGASIPAVLEPGGQVDNSWRTKIELAQKGEYVFHLTAWLGQSVLEEYEKVLRVGSTLNEGARLEVDEAFLDGLAKSGGGTFHAEKDYSGLIDSFAAEAQRKMVVAEMPLVQDKGVYLAAVLVLLAIEWIVRRRMNLV